MKILLTLSFVLFSFYSKAQSYGNPESAEYDYANHRWLISNTQSHEIIARDSTGALSVFVTGISSGPYGIEIVGDTLFCCCGTSIKGFLLSDGSPVFTLNVGAAFLNGITHDDLGNLITTDFNAKAIYKVNIAAQTFTSIASALGQSPNGIIYDGVNNRCVFVNWGSNAPIKAIDMTTNAVSTIVTTTLGSCDGVARDGQGRYYVSAWSSQSVVRFDSSFAAPPITVVTGLNNPADIFYNVMDDTLGIPNAGNNSVTFFGFGTVSVDELISNNNIHVFPNPADDFLRLTSEGFNSISEFCISDLSGKRIVENTIESSGDGYKIDINSLYPGIYFLNIYFKNGLFETRKFVKQ